jgi:hypothetical protein
MKEMEQQAAAIMATKAVLAKEAPRYPTVLDTPVANWSPKSIGGLLSFLAVG